MLYYLFYELLYDPEGITSCLRVFKYITFRTAVAALTALTISIFFTPIIIKYLKKYKLKQVIREDYLEGHIHKANTPTMGGIIVLLSIIISVLLWTPFFHNRFIVLILLITISLGIVGFIDDYIKIVKAQPDGLRARYKFFLQTLIGFLCGLYLFYFPLNPTLGTSVSLPFFRIDPIDFGWFYILFVTLIIVASSNAVNITDGLDGLAIGCLILASLAFAGLAYVAGHVKFAEYLKIIYVSGAGELTVFLGALVGAGIGFLWYNAYPAEIFLGDTGSLSLGGILGAIAVITKQEIALIIIGGLFVIETLSVILQVLSVKLRGKRIFNMAPIHHHFELKGWAEPKVIVRFWIIAGILVLLSLTTLKLR
jgi:phospho-N-acetylmuramoyl-pentapeptide-transferase